MSGTKKVLVDTSTLFSALGWSGAPFRVLVKIHEENFRLVLTDYILEELMEHISDYSLEDKWVENLKKAEEMVGKNKDAPIMAAFFSNR